MFNYNKRNRIMISIILSIIIWISINFILIKFQENQKKEVNSTFTLKTSQINSNLNPNSSNKNEPINEIQNTENKEIVQNQYKSYNWRILISKINLDAPILEGTSKEVLRKGVGHFEQTGKTQGNICLAAHNRGYKYNYFHAIDKLDIGDKIEYQINGESKYYTVVCKDKIKETDLSCLENTKENKLTLITCVVNMPEYRFCVQAKEIKI